MSKYATVIFDLDGTLLNTLDDLTSATNFALARHNMPPRARNEVRRFVGNGILNLIRAAVPAGTDDATIAAVHQTFDDYYSIHNLDATAPYPGIIDLVERLKARGLRCCVVSNKGDYAVQPLIRHFFGDLFEVVVGEREKDGIRRKPWPDTVLACMDAVGSGETDTVYVGDSEVDILTARNAQIPCISVTWGFRSEDLLVREGAQTCAHSVGELETELTR